MKVHHLNCGSFCPLIGSDAICHCLLIATRRSGLVLVDTGIGHAVAQMPRQKMTWMNRVTLRPRFDLAQSAVTQIAALGYAPKDVRHIVVTHLDPDHAGGLQDFPEATVHVHQTELALAQRKGADPRYVQGLWTHGAHFHTYCEGGDKWFGCDAVNQLGGLDEEIALVPLVGHTHGHCGVAVKITGGWLLHAGDAYLEPTELDAAHRVALSVRFAAWLTSVDQRQRKHNHARLRALAQTYGSDVRVFCAHSPAEFRTLESTTYT